MHYLLLAACLATGVGCTEPGPIDRVQVLSPGRAMRLVYRWEVHESRASVKEERHADCPDTATQPSIDAKRIATPHESVHWGDGELSVRVAAMPGSDNVRATMTVQKLRMGSTDHRQGEDREGETFEFKRGSSAGPASEQKEELVLIRDTEFISVIDPAGQGVSYDIKGKYWDAHKKDFSEALKQGVTRGDIVQSLSWQTPGIFPGLPDAMAYLPPQGVESGQSWKTPRARVLPYFAYAFYMFTNGCGSSQEESTCTLKSIRSGIRGKIAVIAIRGKRFPTSPDPNSPMKGKYFDLAGELEVNLTTGAVEKLRLESTPAWAKPKGYESMYLKFVEAISLKPA
jgi:hypothetical protein